MDECSTHVALSFRFCDIQMQGEIDPPQCMHVLVLEAAHAKRASTVSHLDGSSPLFAFFRASTSERASLETGMFFSNRQTSRPLPTSGSDSAPSAEISIPLYVVRKCVINLNHQSHNFVQPFKIRKSSLFISSKVNRSTCHASPNVKKYYLLLRIQLFEKLTSMYGLVVRSIPILIRAESSDSFTSAPITTPAGGTEWDTLLFLAL